jgi:CBS domain-containing protein
MREADIGALSVVDGDELVGIVTDRDLVVRGTALGADAAWVPVARAMT